LIQKASELIDFGNQACSGLKTSRDGLVFLEESSGCVLEFFDGTKEEEQ
jgi:hypothetical protein